MKADIHRYVPGVSTVGSSRDIVYFGWEIQKNAYLLYILTDELSLLAGAFTACPPAAAFSLPMG